MTVLVSVDLPWLLDSIAQGDHLRPVVSRITDLECEMDMAG
jgi:hypothetical protein